VTSIAGAYWLGDEKNQQLQRIYGTAFFNTKDLDAHFKQLEEIKARDHRVLGKQLDLFSIQEVAGAGLIFWHPKGGLIRKIMEDWMRDECVRRGYSPRLHAHLMRRELWKISGHEENYAENMYPPWSSTMPSTASSHELPGHILIYKNSPKSTATFPALRRARQRLPLRALRHHAWPAPRPRLHAGRRHIFCTPEQIEGEIADCIDFAESVLKTFGFTEFKIELSTWDPRIPSSLRPGTMGARRRLLTRVLDAKNIPTDHSGRSRVLRPQDRHQTRRRPRSTVAAFHCPIRLELPARFELEYIGEDGAPHQPVMVHRALFGSVERFFGVLIEHYAGPSPSG